MKRIFNVSHISSGWEFQKKWISPLLFILTIILALPVAESKIVPIQSFHQTKTVAIQSGDTLWNLAGKYYGQGQQWRLFRKDNRFTNPNLIYPGDNLRVRLNAPIGSGSTIPLPIGTFPVIFSATKSVDAAILEYEWDGKKYQMTNSEFVTAFQDLPGYRQENYDSEEGRVEYLQELLSEKLKLLAAESAGFHEDEDLLHKAEDYRNQLLVERLTEVEVDEKVAYTDQELMDYYEAHKEEYVEEETVRATCVSLLDENKAEEAYAMFQEGSEITEIAEKFKNDLRGPGDGSSDPGNTGFFTRDASENWMPFVDAIFDMEIGGVTEEQMELDIGDDVYYLIFRKEEQKPSRQETFDEVKDNIVTVIEQQKKRERILSWVDEVTREGKLKLYPELIPVPEKPTEEEAAEETDGEDADQAEETSKEETE